MEHHFEFSSSQNASRMSIIVFTCPLMMLKPHKIPVCVFFTVSLCIFFPANLDRTSSTDSLHG